MDNAVPYMLDNDKVASNANNPCQNACTDVTALEKAESASDASYRDLSWYSHMHLKHTNALRFDYEEVNRCSTYHLRCDSFRRL